MIKEKWIHIISDLYECDFNYFINIHTHYEIKEYIQTIVIQHGLHIIWSQIHIFENNSFSLNIMLSESHLCIHTWPEEDYISLDIFVCNYTKDNSNSAKEIYKDLKILFVPWKEKLNIINR